MTENNFGSNILLFKTIIAQDSLPNFQDVKGDYIEAIFKYKEKSGGNKNNLESNNLINAFQTETQLHSDPTFEGLFEYISTFLVESFASEFNLLESNVYITSSWANICNKGNIISEHIHKYMFSGVFYVSCPEGSGKLCFKNNSINKMWNGLEIINNKNESNSIVAKIEPQEGTVLIWPSYLEHYVEPSICEEPRISISFEIVLIPKNGQYHIVSGEK